MKMLSCFWICMYKWIGSSFQANAQNFSVNACSQASRSFRSDSDFCAFVIVVAMCVATQMRFGHIFHVLSLLCFLFHLMKQTLVFIHAQSSSYTTERRKISVGTELFTGRPAWARIDKRWICSSSCFRNGVKWNVKCSKVAVTVVHRFTEAHVKNAFLQQFVLLLSFVFVFVLM